MSEPVERASAGPVATFLALPLGVRVVVRYRVGDLATDVLGLLVGRGDDSCDIRTRRGDVHVRFADIVAAKMIPPPVRRPVRRSGPATG